MYERSLLFLVPAVRSRVWYVDIYHIARGSSLQRIVLTALTDSTSEVATATDVVDLLVNMIKVAAKSSRKELIVNPFPQVFHHERQDELVLDPKSPVRARRGSREE